MSELEDNIILAEQKSLWNYYIRTLDERQAIFGYYLKIVTLPAAVISAATIKFITKNDITTIDFQIANQGIGGVLLAITWVGIACYINYHLETKNSHRYIRALRAIRSHFREKYNTLEDVLVLDKVSGVNNFLGSIPFWRGMVIATVNSLIATFAIFLLGVSGQSLLVGWCAFIISMIFHIIIATICKHERKF